MEAFDHECNGWSGSNGLGQSVILEASTMAVVVMDNGSRKASNSLANSSQAYFSVSGLKFLIFF
jgi:hypothetical protein